MPPKRPPPLPKSLFVNDGALAPGSAPLPPSPTSIHPTFIVDAHAFPERPTTDPEPIFVSLPQSYPRPPVRSVVQVKLDVSAEPAPAVLGVRPFSIHPTILNLTLATPPSITNIAKGAVDIIVPCTAPLSEKEWDLLDEAVDALAGLAGTESASPVGSGGKIVISGLLPPPLTKSSTSLYHDEEYQLYLTRLSQLSFHPNVYLKALPPVLDTKLVEGQEEWWTDLKSIERVLRMYVSPAIETFGTHRLIFGTCPALPLPRLALATLKDTSLVQPIATANWYATLRKVITEIGEDQAAVNDILGGNGARVYQLE